MSVDQIRIQPHRNKWLNTGIFAGLFFLVLFLQILSGSYKSEFAGYPDEPAHYVTGVMVRDYLLSGKLTEPMAFAVDYYNHYPKVAFGHWPPLLYAIQGVWMILFSESRTSILLELALTTTIAAFLLYLLAKPHFGRIAGILSAVLLICLPEIQTYTSEVMAESLLLVTTFQAAVFFYRYLERKRWQDSLWFGIFCSLAILTKGTGWSLAIIPPLALVLTRDWRVLIRPSFWIPIPVVGILCIPWQVMTMEMASRGWTGGAKPNVNYTLEALGEFGLILISLVGWAIIVLALWGIILQVAVPVWKKGVKPLYAVMFSLIVAMWVFHSVVPAGVESRKLINALPGIIIFAVVGGQSLASFIATKWARKTNPVWSYVGVATATILLFALNTFFVPREEHYGFTELSSYIESRPDLGKSVILVSSERDGEGLLISELMMQDRRPDHTILRASKVLSKSDWNGNVSEVFCRSPKDVMDLIKREQVKAVVLDTFPRKINYQHHELILEAIRKYPASWHLTTTFGNGNIQFYELKQI